VGFHTNISSTGQLSGPRVDGYLPRAEDHAARVYGDYCLRIRANGLGCSIRGNNFERHGATIPPNHHACQPKTRKCKHASCVGFGRMSSSREIEGTLSGFFLRRSPWGIRSAVSFPSRPRRRKSEPEPASALVSAVVGSMGGNWRGREHQVFAIYADIGGDFLRKHTRPDALRDGTLFVRVSSSAIAHHLTLLRGEILQRMAPLLPPGIVTDIRTRVGPLG